MLVHLGFVLSSEEAGLRKVNKVSFVQLQIADCEKRIAKSQESRSFYIFKRYLNKILNEAGKLGLVSI